MQATAFDAWKNFILVLAGVLASDMLTSLGTGNGFVGSIHDALLNFLAFDKWHASELQHLYVVPLLTILVVIYFVKCIHGILVGIFSSGFYEQLKKSPWTAMRLCFFATLPVVSLIFAPWFSNAVADQRTIFMGGVVLMSMVAVPTAAFMFFDTLRFSFDDFHIHLRGFFSATKDWDRVVGKWIVEDFFLLAVLAGWLSIMIFQIGGAAFQLDSTLFTLSALLFVPSILDYFANRAFFFDFKP